jgi:death on curing protein
VKEPVWIREIEALAFHVQLIALFGSTSGVRDRGLLDSALDRPKNLFARAENPVKMVDLAAAYAIGISSDHPFLDRNKRMAM